jgi:hypothetical protein
MRFLEIRRPLKAGGQPHRFRIRHLRKTARFIPPHQLLLILDLPDDEFCVALVVEDFLTMEAEEDGGAFFAGWEGLV